MSFNPTPQLVHGTIEYLQVLVVDATGTITDLSTASPTFFVNSVDADSGLDLSPPVVPLASGVAVAMLISALIDTTTGGGQRAFAKAGSAVVLPLTVALGVNDEFQYNATTYTITPGIYATLDELGAAVQDAVNITPEPLSLVAQVTNDGTYLTITGNGAGPTDDGLLLNVGGNDVLVDLGFTDGQALDGGFDAPWSLGQYNLYVGFTEAPEVPILGPYTFYVI